MTETITIIKKQGIAHIIFNRPKAMNSLNETMANEFLAAVREIQADKQIHALILRGEGPLFMAGGDIGFFHNELANIHNKVDSLIETVHEVVETLRAMPQIIIAAVHGSVAGIGMSFMLACDLIIAADNTKFTTAYSRIGTTSDGGLSYFLPRIVGYQKALELILFAEVFSSQQAMQLGLINHSVEPDKLLQHAETIAQQLCQGPRLVHQRVKTLLNQSRDNKLPQQLSAEQAAFAASVQSKDFHSGVQAFIKKEKPEFIGE